jgi:hypothetical protein
MKGQGVMRKTTLSHMDEKEGLVRERSTKEAAAVIEACFPSHTSKVRNLHGICFKRNF